MLRRSEKRYSEPVRSQYIEFMKEYEELEHMSKATSHATTTSYYIPHRAVVKPDSITTKLRVVFNASAKSSSNLSLNDLLHTGPTIQPPLVNVLIRFRRHNIAWSADIVKMYRQILIHEKDRDLQRILWRTYISKPIEEYWLNTLTYGTRSAAFIATYCLTDTGKTVRPQLPEVANAIENDFVIDDLLTGASHMEEASRLLANIHSVLADAHFPLRKYMSNSEQLLSYVEPDLIAPSRVLLLGEKNPISLLGLRWDPVSDSFQIKLSYPSEPPSLDNLTKRKALSEISRMYDPLGFVSPVTIRSKILLQNIWKENLQWDETLPEHTRKSFHEYYADLSNLQQLSLRRRYSKFDKPVEMQLIGFCDASKSAYAAVIYLRSVDSEGNIDCQFVISKTRVAPKNAFVITIPKLELQAAELLSRLIVRVSSELKISSMFAFSDSTCVLAWLKGDISRWSIFVQNRVEKILSIMSSDSWSYCNTKINPADVASRGTSVRNLISLKYWLNGPDFVYDQSEFIRMCKFDIVVPVDSLPEVRKTALLVTQESSDLYYVIEKFSKFTRLINVFSYIARFTRRIADENNVYRESVNLAIRVVQHRYFCKTIVNLSTRKILPRSDPLIKFNPFLDENGILRSKSRLQNAGLSFEFTNLIILPVNSNFTLIYVRYLHVKYFHASVSFIVNFVKSMYCVRGGVLNVVKRVVHECVICRRFSAKTAQQQMGQLPACRVQFIRPFHESGVDLAGPFKTKCIGHRVTKFGGSLYAAMFVCMSSKAVHIEVLSSLSAESFIGALNCFIARRGRPSVIHSDNGTNFVGTRNLMQASQSSNISWKFIPPRSPHKGGLWEAVVKCAKRHLYRATKGQVLTFEEYKDVFTTIEGILNSRPLCKKNNTAFTPGHLLVGSHLLIPLVSIDQQPKSFSTRFQLRQTIIQSFWNHYSKDYLNQIRLAAKWQIKNDNVQVGDVVVVKGETASVGEWPLGLISRVYPDKDGLVRVVDVKSKSTIKRRSINSIIPLISDDSSPGGVC